MLRNLYIENIAVIEKTSIDFTEGLNILTGETGAGKSIVIDAINAILGNRTSKDLIRNGCETAFVSAEFEDLSDISSDKLSELGYETEEDGSVLIQRELSLSGKGKCRINGRPASVSVLREIGECLIDIHGQHASYELMSPELHITYIDKLADIDDLLEKYRSAYSKYVSIKAELNKASLDESERERKIDLLRYQVNELELADFYVGEYEELRDKRIVIENREKITAAEGEAHEYLSGNEETDGAIRYLELACDSLSEISGYLPELEETIKRLQNVLYELEDCDGEIMGLYDDSYSEGESLEVIDDRLDLIYTLGKKYGTTIEEMLSFLDNAKKELEYLEKFDENRADLEKKCSEARTEAENLAKEISEIRKNTSEQFAAAVRREMKYLDMPNVELIIRQELCELNRNGCDDIEILISTNPGESPKPVAKIASGGELSRMMLAIKNVLADKDNTDTLIFDEVDTGISGRTASSVGALLRQLGSHVQVITVTHLPQVAASAHQQFLVNKEQGSEYAHSHVFKLDEEGRVEELSRMMGGNVITEATKESARALLKESGV